MFEFVIFSGWLEYTYGSFESSDLVPGAGVGLADDRDHVHFVVQVLHCLDNKYFKIRKVTNLFI